jgi:hypothetical protein
LRFVRIYDYLIAYAPDERPLWVVAILRGSRIRASWQQFCGAGKTNRKRLPEPDVLAEEIIENLEAELNSFRTVLSAFAERGVTNATRAFRVSPKFQDPEAGSGP